jgi:hypothetical protein
VTLLPRHAPSSEGAKVSPMCPEYGVTYLSGRTPSALQSLSEAAMPDTILWLLRQAGPKGRH